MKKKVTIWFLVLALLLPLFPTARAAATYNYPVEGGNLEFDPSTGTIVKGDYSITSANIPSEMSSKGAVNKIGGLSNSPVYLDGTQMAFTAYNIDGNNYFKLRDIGAALNFSVEWNGARQSIEIDTSLPYRPE